MCDYEQILSMIHAHGRFGGAPGLVRIEALLDALGNPQKQLKFVHIAGTNGKGSTAVLTASVLEQAGYHTGLFVSPYILDFCERIRIDGVNIPHAALCRIAQRVYDAEQTLHLPQGESIAEFEFTTACAMVYYAEQHCDIVVLEVGLGGHYDPTNIIDCPEVCVMTHIALDHMAVLGNTMEAIAQDKSHIVKTGGTLVSYAAQEPSVRAVLQDRCSAVGAIYQEGIQPENISCSIHGTSCTLDGHALSVRMIGMHQAYNASAAYTALCVLRKKGWNISDDAIKTGFAVASMPARQEIVQEQPLVMIDGAHNVDGITALCSTIDTMLPSRRLSLVLGMVADKQYQDCVHMLAQRAQTIYAVQPDSPRALSSQELTSVIHTFAPQLAVFDCGDVKTGLHRACEHSKPEDVIIVCGSLYLGGDAKKALCNGIV